MKQKLKLRREAKSSHLGLRLDVPQSEGQKRHTSTWVNICVVIFTGKSSFLCLPMRCVAILREAKHEFWTNPLLASSVGSEVVGASWFPIKPADGSAYLSSKTWVSEANLRTPLMGWPITYPTRVQGWWSRRDGSGIWNDRGWDINFSWKSGRTNMDGLKPGMFHPARLDFWRIVLVIMILSHGHCGYMWDISGSTCKQPIISPCWRGSWSFKRWKHLPLQHFACHPFGEGISSVSGNTTWRDFIIHGLADGILKPLNKMKGSR
jgi:hypothetical protein